MLEVWLMHRTAENERHTVTCCNMCLRNYRFRNECRLSIKTWNITRFAQGPLESHHQWISGKLAYPLVDHNNTRRGVMNLISRLFLITCSLSFVHSALSIRCYQCSSDEDKSTDSCGSYEPFDTYKNSPVDCMAEDAVTPGTFCYKSIQQGPRGFVWDGRWRTVIRRCAQISERGISWGCDWGFHENGVYWEECYCAEDGCNGSTGSLDNLIYSGRLFPTMTMITTMINSVLVIVPIFIGRPLLGATLGGPAGL